MEEERKSISFDVNMNSKILYDYQLHHAYTSASGLLGACFGAAGILMFVANREMVLYLIIGILLIVYLPITLKYRCEMAARLNETYKKPLHYELSEEGITVSQGEISETLAWDKFTKAVSTPMSIVIYSGKTNATVFPRKDLGDKLPGVLAVMGENMDPKKLIHVRQ